MGQISLVDEHERVLANLYVRPDQAVVSYLTPLTGLTAALLAQHGMPLHQARGRPALVYQHVSQLQIHV